MKSLLQKFQKMPDNLKATIVFGIASFATSGINYITTPIFTRLLTDAQYGVVAQYNAWYSIIQVFASMSLIFPGIMNVGLYEHRDNRWKFLSSMLGLTGATTLMLALFYVLFREPVEQLLNLPPDQVILMLMMCFFGPATTFWTFKQRYEYRYQITFFVSVGSAVLAQLVSVIAVFFAGQMGVAQLSSVRLWSAGIVNLAVAIVLHLYICRTGRDVLNFPLWKATAAVALPLIPHYIGSSVLSNINQIMIGNLVGDTEAGIYSLAAVISAIGVLLWRALNVTYNPFVNAKMGERKFADVRAAVKPLLFVVGLMCIIGSLAAPEIIRILATESYMAGVGVIPPVAAGIFIHALYDNFSAVSFFHKKSFHIMLATLAAAVSNVILSYFAITHFGFVAAGYATLAANLILCLMHYLISRSIEKEPICDPRFALGMTLAVIAGCLLCNLLYNTLVIRYLLILALLAVIIYRRKWLINALVSMRVN